VCSSDLFEIESIPREENREADRLANEAIERRMAMEKGRELKKTSSLD
jgi:ribonuclease HI